MKKEETKDTLQKGINNADINSTDMPQAAEETGTETETKGTLPSGNDFASNGQQDAFRLQAAQIAAAKAAAAAPTKKPIGDDEIKDAYATLNKYRSESQALRHRIIENQLYYEFTCTSGRARNKNECECFKRSTAAYLFNAIANKHADFMDNMPMPTILPQEESDRETAKILSDVIPAIFSENRFQKSYSKACFDKLVGGASLYAVTWDGSADNGLGKIRINNAEILNLYWKGGISELEDSPNLFYVTTENNKDLITRFPDIADSVNHGYALDMDKFIYEDEPQKDDMTLVVDWYYRRPTPMLNAAGERVVKNVLHFCKFAAGKVLFASENETDPLTGEPLYPDGYYAHGRYPYVIDTLFPIKGSPAGFGYVDVMKNPQEYIDELDTAVLKNAEWCAEPHYFVPVGAGINVNDIREKKQFIEVSALSDQIKLMENQGIDSNVLNIRNLKTEELKETSGNTDFAQGTTSSGVTAASAIAALQEAGSKLSRDMIKNSYEVYADMCTVIIELIRQFYTISRIYRITKPNEEYAFEAISSKDLGNVSGSNTMFGIATGDRKPYFDIKVDAQKASPFSRAAQNELALQLYTAGFFNPQLGDQALSAIDMMQFESKDTVQQKISRNAALLSENMQLKQYVVQLTQMLAQAGNEETAALANAVAEKYGQDAQQLSSAEPSGNISTSQTDTDNLGNMHSTDTKTDRVRKTTQERTEVK